jgi:fructosamine-3-kinase
MNEGKFFEKDFLAEYQKYKPLPPGFEERKNLYRFYDWLFRQISRDGHPHKKFLQKVLIKIKKLAQKK